MDIKAIDPSSVHRICSGQVVLTLAVAVKELVENAVDASATCIDVKVKDYGQKSIEVSDNGTGVEAKNFQSLTLKHHTSKINSFEDLDCGVTTFGFRGEALSSLCALSNLSVSTRHKDTDIATRIIYDYHGKIAKQTSCARQAGTTVILDNLFHTLPVRYKEFHKNIKREFHKMVSLLSAYCVISCGVKITCTNQTGASGKKSVVLSSNGSVNMKDNISSVFGSKQLSQLVEFILLDPSDIFKEEFGCHRLQVKEPPFSVMGFVSSCEQGSGRGSSDRQYLFINGRPCEIDKVSRLINEIYHMFNKHQYPCVFLNIQVEKSAVDVNVTPDKKKIFLDYEPFLLASLKTSLLSLWEPLASTYTQQTLIDCSMSRKSDSVEVDVRKSTKRLLSDIYEKVRNEQACKRKATIETYLVPSSQLADPESSACISNSSESQLSVRSLESSAFSTHTESETEADSSQTDIHAACSAQLNAMIHKEDEEEDNSTNCTINEPSTDDDYNEYITPSLSIEIFHPSAEGRSNSTEIGSRPRLHDDICRDEEAITVGTSLCKTEISQIRTRTAVIETLEDDHMTHLKNSLQHKKPVTIIYEHATESRVTKVVYDEEAIKANRREIVVDFSVAQICSRLSKASLAEDNNPQCPKFRAKISPDQNNEAENELKKSISKEDFMTMKVLGQFNLGFIIAQLNNDLFIVDQHASDEKYNFEMLQRHTVIKRQKLLMPKPLGLSSSNEILLMDNLEAFHKNGFEFTIYEDAEPTQRVSMKTQPVSKNWTFGKDDIDEILYMLREAPGQSFRPSRVRAMFASRACRKSVMIGKALDKADMYTLLHHMSQIEQPWNCPHGRPTMRHLVNLSLLTT